MSQSELTEAERQMAQSFGMSAEEYVAHKTPAGAAEWVRAQAARTEHERIKRAVAAALAERDGEAA